MEKTMTFTVEDALISPMGLAVLSGAGIINHDTNKKAIVHKTETCIVEAGAGGAPTITLANAPIATDADHKRLFVMKFDKGEISTLAQKCFEISDNTLTAKNMGASGYAVAVGDRVFVDYYVEEENGVKTLQIAAESFGGTYYLEAETLFRDEETGEDYPAELIMPTVKVQSNFTFTMASSGDPSTFTFTMDAMPGYTVYDQTKKTICDIQIHGGASGEDADGADSLERPTQGGAGGEDAGGA